MGVVFYIERNVFLWTFQILKNKIEHSFFFNISCFLRVLCYFQNLNKYSGVQKNESISWGGGGGIINIVGENSLSSIIQIPPHVVSWGSRGGGFGRRASRLPTWSAWTKILSAQHRTAHCGRMFWGSPSWRYKDCRKSCRYSWNSTHCWGGDISSLPLHGG